ncbi:MAG: SDR family NAD(P)-dependent oxidoreductase, partial [Halieaceae bacterium]|nr:SDR family NAD(P)-dependent oxidoreductase [Halieaceae bacterium]
MAPRQGKAGIINMKSCGSAATACNSPLSATDIHGASMTTSKSVLITGATRGLGENLARHFARRGYRLALTGRKQADLERLAA